MKFLSVLILSIVLMAVACGPEETSSNTRLTAPMQDAEGSSIGSVTMQEGPTGFLVNVTLSDLPPGWHAIHIHAVGECRSNYTFLDSRRIQSLMPSLLGQSIDKE